MFWRVAINHLGVLRQICMGKDPSKIAKEQSKIKKEDPIARKRIRLELIFTKCKNDRDYDIIVDEERWMSWFNISDKIIYQKNLEKIAAKYGAAGTMAGMMGYEMGINTEGDKIEILVDVPAKDYSEFHKKYGGREGAIELLYNAQRVYSSGDPAKLVLKWVKKLELEMEE